MVLQLWHQVTLQHHTGGKQGVLRFSGETSPLCCIESQYIAKMQSDTTCLMFVLLRCSYIVSLNDMFRSLPRAIFRLIAFFFARQTIKLAMPCYCYKRDLVDNNNIALLIVWFALQRKNDQPEDDPWKGRNMSLKEAI